MSESLKARQLQFPLQAEKQVLDADMQHANSDADLHKQRITYLEEQVCTLLFSGFVTECRTGINEGIVGFLECRSIQVF